VVGEYDGADHLREDRRRHDIDREELFRDHGLEYFTVVRGGLASHELLARRMRAVRARAPFTPPDRRRWTLDPPSWFEVPETLDERLVRLGLADDLCQP
jgi:hypothetical protein